MSEIGNTALSGCNGLTKIIFLGTEEEWLAITKASNWDTQTSLYVVECLDKTIEKNG